MSLIKVVWYVLRVKNMHPGSPSDPSGTAPTEAKPRCVYSILKPHGQSSRCQVRLLPLRQSQGAYTQFWNHMVRVSEDLSERCWASVSAPPQSRSKAVVCVSTPRMYPRSGYFLVSNYFIMDIFFAKFDLIIINKMYWILISNFLKSTVKILIQNFDMKAKCITLRKLSFFPWVHQPRGHSIFM